MTERDTTGHDGQSAVYLIEFGPDWPVPPITVDYSDPNAAARTIPAHARRPARRARLVNAGDPRRAMAGVCPTANQPPHRKANPMTTSDAHVQHTWNLTRDTDGDRISIDLWTDGYTVRVDGGPDDGHDDDRGRQAIEEQLLPKYAAAGYRLASDYAVNDPEQLDVDGPAAEPDGKPDGCPECGSPVEYAPNHSGDYREGPAWLCTGCRWGQYLVA